MGSLDLLRPSRDLDKGTLVQLALNGATAVLQLNDSRCFNTFSAGLSVDVRRAADHVIALPRVASVVLHGAGPHFSAGGNPYTKRDSLTKSFEGLTQGLRECYKGVRQLRVLLLPSPVPFMVPWWVEALLLAPMPTASPQIVTPPLSMAI